jgi:hypothetical protein
MIIGDDYEDYDELLPKKELFYLKENLMDVIIVHHEIIKIIVQTNFRTMITGDDYDGL